MAIINEKFTVSTKGFTDIIDISNKLEDLAYNAGIDSAIANVYVIGSTAAITTIEYEPGLIKDLPLALENIAPVNKDYFHDQKWKDGNGHAHIRASIIGSSINIPIIDGHFQLGTWQQVVLIDFDNKPRTRNIIVQFVH